MSEFKVKGKIKEIMPVESGVAKSSGDTWKKVNFTVTNNDGYEGREQLYCFQIFSEKSVDNFLKYNQEGQQVEVSFNVQTNEWQGKYFTNLQAYRVDSGEMVEQGTQSKGKDELPNFDDDAF